jgi:hypothetical protein
VRRRATDKESPDPKGPGFFMSVNFPYWITSNVTVVVWVIPPPFAVIVMVRFPVRAVRPTFTVIVDVPDPGAAIELGLKLTLFALPCPDADKVIAELKPPETDVATVTVPELDRATVIDLGDALRVKAGVPPLEVTANVTLVVAVVLPEVPVTVIA